MKLLDLFCGAGGAGMGYHRAGFEVVGVDIRPQPRYPFEFHQADALDYLSTYGREFDAIHASPPCQGYSALRCLPWLKDREYPMLIEACREALRVNGKPYVIENVERAPMENGLTLCGRMFGLPIYRHRQFESSELLLSPGHAKHDVVIGAGRMLNDRRKGTLNSGSAKGAWGKQTIVTVAGGQCRKDEAERALGIDWMQKPELMQAIPPAYTEYIGRQLSRALFVLCALLFASVASADPILSSHSGCVTSLPTGASWTGEDFLFMAFHSPEQGCAPTIENPTRGLFIESSLNGQFRVDVPAFLLAGGCGRYQFDAHVRIPGGLSTAPGGLQTLVYDTWIDCVSSPRSTDTESAQIRKLNFMHGYWPSINNPVTPPQTPPGETPPTQPPISVPENSSTWLLGGLSVLLLRALTTRAKSAVVTNATT